MQIPLVDLTAQHKIMAKEIQEKIAELLENSEFILGKELVFLETEFAGFCRRKYAAGTGSGTAAILFSLLCLGIGKGDEVVIPGNSFIATAHAVLLSGATPIPAEIEEKTYNLDPEKLEQYLSPKTRALIPVHLYGLPAPMDKILKIAKKYKLHLIEDACQAHGACFKNQPVGSFGELSCFSFYPSKNLGALGDGGMVLTDSLPLSQKIQELRGYGGNRHHLPGFNSRLAELQAAVLRIKLPRLNEFNRQRRKAAGLYSKTLKDTPLILPSEVKDCLSAWHLYVIRTPQRFSLMKFLNRRGIKAKIHYPAPFYKLKPYRRLYPIPPSLPVTEKACREVLSLPLFPGISLEQIEYVTSNLKLWLKAEFKSFNSKKGVKLEA